MYTIQGLRAFVAVCQSGTVTSAADMLRRTQPQVSRLITELEAEVGFALFVREGRRLTPTERGVRFFEEARRTLASFDDIARVASELRGETEAMVRIIAPPHAAHSIIPPAIARLREENPKLRIDLQILARHSVGAWAAYKPFDIGIAALPFDLPWIRKEPFARTRMLILVPKKHPLANVPRISAAETAKYPFVALSPAAPTRQQMDLAFQEFGITPKIVCETQTIVSACQLVSYGIGITAVDPLLMTAIDLTNVKAVEWEIPIHIEYCLFRPISGSTSEFADKVASALHDVVKVLLGGSTGRIKRAANS